MINHHLVLYDLLDRTMSVDFDGHSHVANYTEGDLFELTKKLNDSKTKYPIIWMQSGFNFQENQQSGLITLSNCKLFFITLGSLNDRYKKRFSTTYNDILYTLYEKFKKQVRKSDGVQILNENIEGKSFPFNDTTELNRKDGTPQKTTINDIWDAFLLDGLSLKIDPCHYENYLIKI